MRQQSGMTLHTCWAKVWELRDSRMRMGGSHATCRTRNRIGDDWKESACSFTISVLNGRRSFANLKVYVPWYGSEYEIHTLVYFSTRNWYLIKWGVIVVALGNVQQGQRVNTNILYPQSTQTCVMRRNPLLRWAWKSERCVIVCEKRDRGKRCCSLNPRLIVWNPALVSRIVRAFPDNIPSRRIRIPNLFRSENNNTITSNPSAGCTNSEPWILSHTHHAVENTIVLSKPQSLRNRAKGKLAEYFCITSE